MCVFRDVLVGKANILLRCIDIYNSYSASLILKLHTLKCPVTHPGLIELNNMYFDRIVSQKHKLQL